MPNGIESWVETHHDVVRFISKVEEDWDGGETDCPIIKRHEERGFGGMYELGIEWTNEFEEMHAGVIWGVYEEYIDEIHSFLELKSKI